MYRSRATPDWRRECIAVLTALFIAACADDTGGHAIPDAGDVATDVDDGSGDVGCAFGELEGFCLPEPPRGSTAQDCPSGRVAGDGDFGEGGVCLPDVRDWTCPDGWLVSPALVDGSGASRVPELLASWEVCVPPPLPTRCPAGFRPAIGSSECERIGAPCPADARFADDASIRAAAPGYDGAIVFVDPDAPDDGDGSRAAPWSRISQALPRVEDGGIVALAPGTYTQRVLLSSRVALVGACAEGSIIEAPARENIDATVHVSGDAADVLITQLTVTGDAPGIDVVSTGPPAVIRAVVLDQTLHTGIGVNGAGARARVSDVLATGIRRDIPSGQLGYGIAATVGGDVEVEDAALIDCEGIGAVVIGGSADLARVAMLREPTRRGRIGALVRSDGVIAGAMTVGESAVLGYDEGLFALEGASLEVHDALVRAPLHGIVAGTASAVMGERLVLEGTTGDAVGFFTGDPGTTVDIADVAVRPALGDASGSLASVSVGLGASVALHRGAFACTDSASLVARDAGAELQVEDAVVVGTCADNAQQTGAFGAIVADGAALTLRRLVFDQLADVAVAAAGDGASLSADDLVVTNTAATSTLPYGQALIVQASAQATVQRAWFYNNRLVGAHVEGAGSVLDLRDAVIRDTAPSRSELITGRGMAVERGAQVTGERLHVAGSVEVGVSVASDGSVVDLSDLVVERTLPRTCPAIAEACVPGGVGMVVALDADAALHRFLVRDSAVAGMSLARGGTANGTAGALVDNPIGLNVQTDGFDVERAFDDVRLLRNERDLASDQLSVPEFGPIPEF